MFPLSSDLFCAMLTISKGTKLARSVLLHGDDLLGFYPDWHFPRCADKPRLSDCKKEVTAGTLTSTAITSKHFIRADR